MSQSDTLRTRIAAVLKFHYPGSSHMHNIVADEVIEALGLHVAYESGAYRYVTEWTTDE